ncbi:MAG: histidine phosphatase family protein [Gammaproteobacteria bacterium]|nr:MAG: histidine phosphatase family protein [Gammaproteobacteria bacterium]RTZ80045.1 MAG: histidine phosphatase family protein [Gammaproteobacteria bacterium]
MTTRIDFIRHGEPEGGSMYRGSAIDHPLSSKGWEQMRAALGSSCHWDVIVSSPLRRSLAFAEELGRKHGLPVETEADFREVGFGSWEGHTREEILAQDPEGYAAFYRDPVHCRPAGAEELPAFGRRVAEAFERTLERHAGRRILVVAHAGVIRATLGHVLQAPPEAWYRVQVDNAGISRFQRRNGIDQLLFHNRSRI